jgi:hemoglobin/transferrin/lactoferrin receptor protein
MNKISRVALGVTFQFLVSALAFAQTDSLRGHLNEITIVANRLEEDKQSVPSQIALLKKSDIQSYNLPTLADLLQQSGTLAVQKSQLGGGSPVIRGFEASRVLLVIDDIRLNNLIYRAGHLQNIITVDPSMLDRVEVLFGPSSTVYGSDALGGVIHLRTQDPVFATGDGVEVKGGATLRYSSAAQEKTAQAYFTLARKNISSLTRIAYSTFDDLRMGKQAGTLDSAWGKRYYYVDRINGADSLMRNDNPYLQRYSGYHQIDVMEKLLIRSGEDATHGFTIQYSTSSDIPRYDRLTDPSATGLKYAEWFYGPQSRFLSAYTYERQLHGGYFSRIKSVLSYQHVLESRHTRSFGSDTRTDRQEQVNVAGYTVFAEHTDGAHRLQVGWDSQYSTVQSTAMAYNISSIGEAPQSTRYPDGKNGMSFGALYFSHRWENATGLSLVDGLRATYTSLRSTFEDTTFYPFPFSSVHQDNLSVCGNLGVNYRPDDDWRMGLSLNTGFRAPNVDDLAKVFESSPGQVIVPNPALKPERTLSVECNLSHRFSSTVNVDFTAYHTWYRDAIVTDVARFNGADSIFYDGQISRVLSSTNKQQAYMYGMHTAVTVWLSGQFTVRGSVDYTYGRIKTDSSDVPLDHIPPVYGLASLDYKNGKWSASCFLNFNGWKHIEDYYLNGEDNEQYATSLGMPSWYTVNLRTRYQASERWQVQAGLDNIFDQNYRTFASGIQAPGRNIILSASVRF